MRLPEFCYATPLYQLLLQGATPRHLSRLPPPAWPGDKARGNAIKAGTLAFGGQQIGVEKSPWSVTSASPAVVAELHGFGWLNDLAAAGDEAAAEAARGLVGSWLATHDRWHPESWAPAVLGARVTNWLTHARLLSHGEGSPLDRQILRSLARQVRHLARVCGDVERGVARLAVLQGLIYGIACGLGPARWTASALRRLSRELRDQILPDGGHVARSPADHRTALAALVGMRDMLTLANHSVPPDLLDAIGRMAPVLGLYRHGDAGLALFNGSIDDSPALTDAVMVRAGAGSEPAATTAETGFERIDAGRTCLIMDAGSPPPSGFDRHAHAGTLSFELSWGQERLVVNCGAFRGGEAVWERAQRSTAAHSTLAVDDTNSSEILSDGSIGRRATIVERQREMSDGNVWVVAAHSGYQSNFGLVHRRRLYLAHDGSDLRGEDTLTGTHRGYATGRFHLHPDVRASLVQNGAAVLLRLPSGTAWRFQAAGGRIEIGESVYFGAGERRRAEQITVMAALESQGAQIKWALKRLQT